MGNLSPRGLRPRPGAAQLLDLRTALTKFRFAWSSSKEMAMGMESPDNRRRRLMTPTAQANGGNLSMHQNVVGFRSDPRRSACEWARRHRKIRG